MCRSNAAAFVLMELVQTAATVELLATSYYTDESCAHTPQIVTMDFTYDSAAAESYVAPTILQSSGILSRRLVESNASSCVADPNCTAESYGGNTYFRNSECITDPYTYSVQLFGGNGGVVQPFLMVETYTGDDCETLSTINATVTADGCQFASENSSSSVTLFSNGSALYQLYANGACGGNATRYFVDRAALLNHTCYGGNTKFYMNYDASVDSSNASESNGSSSMSSDTGTDASVFGGTISTPTPTTVPSANGGLGAGAIVGIVVGVSALMFLIAATVICRGRLKTQNDSDAANYRMSPDEQVTMSTEPQSQELAPHGLEGLWDDEVIATARIPREKVFVQHLLSRGAYGEVYAGMYNGKFVAVKMLLRENRKSVRHLNEFLAEVKRTAILDHERIVHLVGVAWDSLADLCAALEYMDGGDLRALLDKLKVQGHQKGFDRIKVKIALHVAHALAYLHSLDQPMIHRDLKSKNILLTENLDAKLTDFGVSRERIMETMTAGVGTSLWMAPEVMMGEKYDDKADMFSFGIVLAELDTHCLPYSNVKRGNKSEAAILQMVAAGKLHIKFSPWALKSVVDLGLACVDVESRNRPTAAQALYKLHQILAQEV